MSGQMSLLDTKLSELTPPVRRRDPESSHQAARRIAPKLSGQLLDVLGAVVMAGPDGASNRDIQIAVCGGDNPGHPAWNKVPTRTKTLWDKGILERMRDPETGDWLVRDHPSGNQGFLVYRVNPKRGTR